MSGKTDFHVDISDFPRGYSKKGGSRRVAGREETCVCGGGEVRPDAGYS